MKRFIGLMLVVLGIAFTTDVYGDIGTFSENSIEIVDDVGFSADIVNLAQIEFKDPLVLNSYSTNFDEATALSLFAYNSKNTKKVLEPPVLENDTKYFQRSYSKTAKILTSNSSNLFIHRCRANK